jgi:hypothetical protein
MWGYLYCYISNSISKKRKTFKPLQLTLAGCPERLVGLCALNKSHLKVDLIYSQRATHKIIFTFKLLSMLVGRPVDLAIKKSPNAYCRVE